MRKLLAVTLLAFPLLASCGRRTEPHQGAFAPEDVVKVTRDEARISVERSGVPLEDMALGRWLAGVPMQGLAKLKIDLAAPVKDNRTLFSRAHGTFAVACGHGCRLGNDVAQLDIRGQKLDVGHIDIDSLALRGSVENGHAKVTQWQLVSPDVELGVDLDIALADDLAASKVEGCIRFAPVAGLDTRRPKTWALLETTGANLDHAGMFSIRITGTLGAPKRLAQECDHSRLAID